MATNTPSKHYDIKKIIGYFYDANTADRKDENPDPLINTWQDPISNMKMMAMLYLAQSICLKEFDTQLFDDDFIVGEYGPVIPSLLREGYVSPLFNYSTNSEWYNWLEDKDVRAICQEVYRQTKNFSALGILNTIKDTPAFKELSKGQTIPNETIGQIDWWLIRQKSISS